MSESGEAGSFCPACGADLPSDVNGVCPECQTEFEAGAPSGEPKSAEYYELKLPPHRSVPKRAFEAWHTSHVVVTLSVFVIVAGIAAQRALKDNPLACNVTYCLVLAGIAGLVAQWFKATAPQKAEPDEPDSEFSVPGPRA